MRISKLKYDPAYIADRYFKEQCRRLGPITPTPVWPTPPGIIAAAAILNQKPVTSRLARDRKAVVTAEV